MPSSHHMRSMLALLVVGALLVGSVLTPSVASAVTVDHEVWVGSPVEGRWNANARRHHWMLNARDRGDWATDITAPAGAPVRLYVAPQRRGYRVTTRVDQIGQTCAYGRRGAKFVAVGIYANGRRIGSVKYGHLRPSVRVGQWVKRWGTKLGTVRGGLPKNEKCWTGPHVHAEMFNTRNYSCFNRGYRIGSRLRRTNFVGFVGGRRVGGYRQPCP